jgi:hypothetical protein
MSRQRKPNLVTEYLNEAVNYGGVRMTRHEMIAQLTRVAKSTVRKDWHVLVERYLQGHATMERLRRA